MSEPEEPSVCDLTRVMRTRLVCGMYNCRSVPPRWRRLARVYCVAQPVAMSSLFFYFKDSSWSLEFSLYTIPTLVLYHLSIFVSLWTGDEYIYKFFNQNKLTDVTLDSTNIFSRLQKRVEQAFYCRIALSAVSVGLTIITFYRAELRFVVLIGLLTVLDQILVFSSSRSLLVMALFDARLLVLKRRLQRYGFRTVGRAQPQPYCQVYDEVLQGLDEMQWPFKLLLFFDIICNCCKFISILGLYLFDIPWKNLNYIEASGQVMVAITILERLVNSFGYVAFLESAAVHCEDMAVFTVTQLIKAPTADERRRMNEFLSALEQRGARYRLLRALPIDARFVLRALGFCTAQIIVAATAVTANSGANK